MSRLWNSRPISDMLFCGVVVAISNASTGAWRCVALCGVKLHRPHRADLPKSGSDRRSNTFFSLTSVRSRAPLCKGASAPCLSSSLSTNHIQICPGTSGNVREASRLPGRGFWVCRMRPPYAGMRVSSLLFIQTATSSGPNGGQSQIAFPKTGPVQSS
jgi:hypothetical protein